MLGWRKVQPVAEGPEEGGLSELARVSVSERSVSQWPSPAVLALALAASQQAGGPGAHT